MKRDNEPTNYRIKRKEFGHGQSRNMNPRLMDTYGDKTFRGFRGRISEGREYEENVGYRQNYNQLGSNRALEDELTYPERRTQDNRGKGPRSYQRSDERILEELNDRMCDNPYLDASEIDITVENGDVILAGIVEDRESKKLAAEIGESVSGVTNVENRLRVRIKGI